MNSPGNTYAFDRPVILLAAPRSGSTLLFETLSLSHDFWTIGGESHGVFERIDRFNPLKGHCDSNALSAADATPEIARQIRQTFYEQLRDATGRPLQQLQQNPPVTPRLLEKTPKNALRVSLLDRIFPGARFVYLYRNPRENISSIMDAWQSGRFVTYRRLPGRARPWSMLLPPGWQSYHNAPIAEIAAFQWQSANTAILNELGKLGADRWIGVSYGQQVNDAQRTIERICDFCQVSAREIIRNQHQGPAKLSRYTLTTPASNKWHKNAAALARVIPGLADTITLIRQAVPDLPNAEFDLGIDPSLIDKGTGATPGETTGGVNWPDISSRNSRCPCGSGKRYKHCHGGPSRNETSQ